MLIVHLIYDTRDAMGANAVNCAVERLKGRIESITGGRVHLRILSNLADRRRARAACKVLQRPGIWGFSGEQFAMESWRPWAFAEADPYRAATHNKGIMNGVDAVVIATGNDWRAIEAGAHAYAARSGRYTSLSRWEAGTDGSLIGSLEMPMAVGTVGGATRVHPMAKANLALMGVEVLANWPKSSFRSDWRRTSSATSPGQRRDPDAGICPCTPVRSLSRRALKESLSSRLPRAWCRE